MAKEATPVTPPLEYEYNTVFERLVGEDDDGPSQLMGFVAYVYYKIAKREWILEFFDREGHRPSQDEIRAYVGSWTETRIGGLRTEANSVLTQFASYIVDQQRPKIVEETLKHRSFRRDVGAAFCGAWCWSVALLLLAIILKWVGIDLLEVLQKVS